LQAFWAVALAALTWWLWRRAAARVTVLGGWDSGWILLIAAIRTPGKTAYLVAAVIHGRGARRGRARDAAGVAVAAARYAWFLALRRYGSAGG
jgi:hypothetical protein